MIAIDVYFILNFMYDLLLTEMLVCLMKYKISPGRLILSALTGALWSCIAISAVWIPVPFMIVINWFVCPFIMCKLSCSPHGKKEVCAVLLCFYLLVFVTGGAMDALWWINGDNSSFWVLLLSMLLAQVMIYISLKIIRQMNESKTLFCNVEFQFNEKKAEMIGIRDTGNRLCSLTGRPIHVVDEIGAAMILEKELLDRIFQKRKEAENGRTEECFMQEISLQWVPFCGIGGTGGLMPVVRIDRMTVVTNRRKIYIEHPLIGISETLFCKGKSYQAILNPQDLL